MPASCCSSRPVRSKWARPRSPTRGHPCGCSTSCWSGAGGTALPTWARSSEGWMAEVSEEIRKKLAIVLDFDDLVEALRVARELRSEERRVGKECECGGGRAGAADEGSGRE